MAEKDETPIASTDAGNNHLSGWPLAFLTTGLCLCVFLSSLDITIVSTSLTAIANDLHNYEQSSWVVSSYLTTYFSFLMIWCKLSDLLGRKLTLIVCVILFLAFSGGCGGAQTILQLIILRAFQGIGGAGIFGMTPIIVAEMVKPEKYAVYNALISLGVATSFLLGPILGGAISDGTNWRWIFFINLPVGVVGIVLIFLTMPAAFPDVSQPRSYGLVPQTLDLKGKIDYPGFIFILAACVLFIVAIEEAGTMFAWDSALVITFLALGGVLFCVFLAWQWDLHRRKSPRESVFPWEFTKHRVMMGLCLYGLLSGPPLMVLVLELPARFQIINGSSGLDAGVRVLPLTLMIACGAGLTGALAARGRVPPIVVLVLATVFQLVGTVLIYIVKPTTSYPGTLYAGQILAGLGIGLSITTLLAIILLVVDKTTSTSPVLAIAMGVVTQSRILGGAIEVSIATNLLNNTLRSKLESNHLSSSILDDASSIRNLSLEDREMLQGAFADGYRKQYAMVLGFCAAQVIAIALVWEKKLRRFV